MSIVQVPLKDIILDPSLQMRETMDPDVIDEYAQDLSDLPPSKIVRGPAGEMWLTGGWHRYHAHKQKSQKTMPCTVRDGTFFDALTEAAGENHGHGCRRTNEDKRRAVAALLADRVWRERSNRMIAEACHVNDKLVAKVREITPTAETRSPVDSPSQPPGTRIGRDGSPRPATQPNHVGGAKILCQHCQHKESIGRKLPEKCKDCAELRKPTQVPDSGEEEEQSDADESVPDDMIVDDDGHAVPAKLRQVFAEAPLFKSAAIASAKAAVALERVEKSLTYAYEDRQAKAEKGDRRLYSTACRTAETRMIRDRPAKICCPEGCKKCGLKGFLTEGEIK